MKLLLSGERARIQFEDAMKLLHTIDRDGTIRTGAYSFVLIWRELPYYLTFFLRRNGPSGRNVSPYQSARYCLSPLCTP